MGGEGGLGGLKPPLKFLIKSEGKKEKKSKKRIKALSEVRAF